MNIFTVNRLGRAIAGLLFAWLVAAMAYSPAAAQTDPTSTPEPAAESTAEPTVTPTFAPPGDIRFGVIESFEDPAATSRLGAAWTRARFQWADVQPRDADEWRPPLDDDELEAELDAGREVVGLLIGIPDWARDRRGLPRGLSLPYDDPDNTWAVFVGEAVGRYAGRIDRWIIWNEPDIDDPDAPGHTWDGTVEEFFQLQRTAYLAAKAANPDAVIHLGAFTFYWDPGYFSRYLDVVAADPDAAAHNYYFDVATAHLYFQPNAVYNIIYAFRRVMERHGLDQPIWLVETNAPPMDDPYWEVENWTLAVTLNEQAAFIPQAIAAAFAAGAERVSVYKLKDTPGDRAANPEPFGLIRWDNSRRPAFDTYRIAIRLLGGVRSAERERWDEVAQVRLDQTGQTTTVLFARLPGPQQAIVPATADSAELVDMWGRRETIEPRNDVFRVELPGAFCRQTIADYCMIGGTTYYLIQQVDERNEVSGSSQGVESGESVGHAGPATETATPTARSSPTARPSATVNPSPTATPTPEAGQAGMVAAAPSETPKPPVADASPLPETISETNAAAPGEPANFSGLIFIGLGLIVGLGMAIRGLMARRGAA